MLVARPVKCAACGEMEKDREKVVKSEYTKRYFHIGDCYDKHVAHQLFVKKEKNKLDKLYEYIKKLHGIPDEQASAVLKGVMWRIQELRNGNDTFEGKSKKRYKMGVEYDLLLEAYILKEKDIQWFIDNVLEGGVTTKDINACLSVALKGLSEAWRLRKLKEKREKEREVLKEELLAEAEKKEYKYVPKKRDNLSDLL